MLFQTVIFKLAIVQRYGRLYIATNVRTALRSGGERETNVSDSTKLPKREQNFKLNINPPFCKTDVI